MRDLPNIAGVAALLSNPARASIAWALVDGSSQPAGDLAASANISPQSASRHLASMLDGGLLEVRSNGRSREYRIANSEVACIVESMATLAAELAADRPCGLERRNEDPAFRHARTCYDHFAGRFGVDILSGMLEGGWLRGDKRAYELTAGGEVALVDLGVNLSRARSEHRVFARACSDLTEDQPHLGGALGAAVLDTCVSRGFVLRSRQVRVVAVTPAGWEALRAAKLLPRL